MKGKRSGLSTCQSKGMRPVGGTHQKGSMCGTVETPKANAETHNLRKAFALSFENLPVCRSVGGRRRRRRWQGRCAWACVSGADVKLLFGHLSDRGPRRLPVSVKSVRGH